MEEKEIQLIFGRNIEGNFMMPLKNGKILFYYFKEDYNIHIYNEKTFQKLFEIDLYEQIMKYKKKKKNKYKFDYDNKNSIKELKNGLILIGLDRYLIQLKLNKNDYDCKIIKQMDDIILDINELSFKKIIIITSKKIIELSKKNNEYQTIKEYSLKENWKMIPKSLTEKFYENFHQYYSSYLLPNNKLLLNSFSTEIYTFRRCNRSRPTPITNSKIIFIDLKNFKEISTTETYDNDIELIILDNCIIIQLWECFNIYDINSLKLIKIIESTEKFGSWYKYNNQLLIDFNHDDNGKITIITYKIENKDLVEAFNIKINSQNGTIDSLDKLCYRSGLITFMNNKIINLYDDEIYVFQLIKNK